MRTTVFVTTLFAVSLCAGAALAEKPHVDRARAHGDVVDKSYRVAHERHAAPQAQQHLGNATSAIHASGASRISCSETGVDCHTGRAAARASSVEASGSAAGRVTRAPAFLDKVLGSDRTNFNEAGESQGMSSRAAQRAWSHVGATAGQGAAHTTLAHQAQHARADGQASTNRMACNEGEVCMASSKASKKEWSYEAVKAGTWSGPEAKQPSPAAIAIAKHNADLAKADAEKSDSGKRAIQAHQVGATQSVSK